MSEKTKAIITLVVMLLLLVVVFLITFGVIDADSLTKAVTAVLAIASAVYAWWKNNNITGSAIKAQEYLDSMKQDENSKAA